MRKAKLIGEEATWQQLNYSRCGRTDKGVSAAGQVVLGGSGGFVPHALLLCYLILPPPAFVASASDHGKRECLSDSL